MAADVDEQVGLAQQVRDCASVGSHALPAFQVDEGGSIAQPDATRDVDEVLRFLRAIERVPVNQAGVDALKQVDVEAEAAKPERPAEPNPGLPALAELVRDRTGYDRDLGIG